MADGAAAGALAGQREEGGGGRTATAGFATWMSADADAAAVVVVA
jgi:hypothetical protein